jgi:hypothetical protein
MLPLQPPYIFFGGAVFLCRAAAVPLTVYLKKNYTVSGTCTQKNKRLSPFFYFDKLKKMAWLLFFLSACGVCYVP